MYEVSLHPIGFSHLVVELLQQTVQPGLSHLHGPRLVGYIAHFDQNHHQLHTHTTLKTQILNSITLLIVFGLCLHLLSSHHFSVLLAGEVKSRQDGLELVENLVVSRHVSGQDASAIMNYDRIKTL